MDCSARSKSSAALRKVAGVELVVGVLPLVAVLHDFERTVLKKSSFFHTVAVT
jgi:hypothetical protein